MLERSFVMFCLLLLIIIELISVDVFVIICSGKFMLLIVCFIFICVVCVCDWIFVIFVLCDVVFIVVGVFNLIN